MFTDPGNEYSISFNVETNQSDDGLRHQIYVKVQHTTAPTQNFSNVSIVFYDSNQSVIKRVHLGTISSDGNVAPSHFERNITTNNQPAYIVVESPDFWESEVSVQAARWTGEYYTMYWISSKDNRFNG
jgi:hypothetical protein